MPDTIADFFTTTRQPVLVLSAGKPAQSSDPKTIKAVKASCFDYIDGQLEANPERVARSLHPDLAKRAVLGDTPYERFGLRRMSKEELVGLTKEGVLKTPVGQWQRTCTILDMTGNAASVRLETPWFVAYRECAVVQQTEDQMGLLQSSQARLGGITTPSQSSLPAAQASPPAPSVCRWMRSVARAPSWMRCGRSCRALRVRIRAISCDCASPLR